MTGSSLDLPTALEPEIEPVFGCLPPPDLGQLEKQLEDASLARRDLEDSSRHVNTLEKQMKALTQERDELHKVTGPGVCVCGFESLFAGEVPTPRSLFRTSWRPPRSSGLSRRS